MIRETTRSSVLNLAGDEHLQTGGDEHLQTGGGEHLQAGDGDLQPGPLF